jgi:DNA-binding response OmpR family regulator
VRHKILIVDDDETTRSGLTQLFERADFDAVAVGTFLEGRTALRDWQPDLLIADVRLGEFNGLQLLATVPHPIPSIIITGYHDSVLESDARSMGADYLVKPISPAFLMTLVRQKLEMSESPALRPARRWERKQLSGSLPARIENRPARILDISYGGLRLEIERQPQQPFPPSFTLDLPTSGLSVLVDLVWTSRLGEERWLCGGSVVQPEDATARAWHGLVDAVA